MNKRIILAILITSLITSIQVDAMFGNCPHITLSDGKLLQVGWYREGDVPYLMIARYNPDGSEDRSFGANGAVKTHQQYTNERAEEILAKYKY